MTRLIREALSLIVVVAAGWTVIVLARAIEPLFLTGA